MRERAKIFDELSLQILTVCHKFIMNNQLEALSTLLREDYGYPIPLALSISDDNFEGITSINIVNQLGVNFAIGIIAEQNTAMKSEAHLQSLFIRSKVTSLGFIFNGRDLLGYEFDFKSQELKRLKSFKSYNYLAGSKKMKLYGSSPEYKSLIKIDEKFEASFFQCNCHIRDIDGLHADEALDELCKIIYTKIFDEENIDQDKPYKFQTALYGNGEELAASIRNFYNTANEYDRRVFSQKIPGYKRSRGVFDKPIHLSAAALTRVVKEIEEFDFTNSNIDVKGRAFQKAFVPALRAGMGQYFTPDGVIKLIVESASPTARDLILDPFCGSGHFLSESLALIRKQEKSTKKIDEFAFHNLHGIEKSERMVRVAMTDMRLHGDGHSNIRCADSLLPFENYHDIESGVFDYVFTNPPFGSLLSSEALKTMGSFELEKSGGNTPLEVIGLERSIQFLRPKGKLAIVLPESIFVNKSAKHVRDWLAEHTTINAIVSLPIETFSPFGANIKTSIMFLTKQKPSRKSSVMTIRLKNIGYDAAGRQIERNDVPKAIKTLSRHLKEEGWT